MKALKLLLFSYYFFFTPVLAQDFIPPMPGNLEGTRISLVTVGLGTALYSRFGHTMIRVVDPTNDLDYLANWGIFDFSDPMFIPKFFRGILIYRMGFSATAGTFRYYTEVESRSIAEDELHLTTAQKRAFMEKLIWNAQPENVRYPYQYYQNNCATMPRDYLSLVTGGAMRSMFEKSMVTATYRDYVLANLAINPFIGWGLDVIFNGDNDQPLNKWQEMFYPIKFREYLATLPSFDDEGNPDSRQPLLTNHRVISDRPEPDGQSIDGNLLAWIVAGVPLLTILCSMMNRRRLGKQNPVNWHNRVFGLVCIWWALTSGFFGLTHMSAWLFSSHTGLHRNINTLLFWPVDPLVLIPGIQLGLLGRGWDFRGLIKFGFWRNLARFHIIFIPIYIIVAGSGIFVQDTSRVLLYLAPLSLLYYGVMALLTSNATVK